MAFRATGILVAAAMLSLIAPSLHAKTPEVVSFPSGDKMLHGLLYKPAGSGPFRTVLYNHGSAPGLLNNEAFARALRRCSRLAVGHSSLHIAEVKV